MATYFEDTDFTAGDSPFIVDFIAETGSNRNSVTFANEGPGAIKIAKSQDGGSIYQNDITLKGAEIFNGALPGTTNFRITHTGEDSSYRLLITDIGFQAIIGKSLGTTTNPVFTTEIPASASKTFVDASGDTQIKSGSGLLFMVCNSQAQDLDIWDFDGGGATDSDLLCEFKSLPVGLYRFDVPFVNGLRISLATGKEITIHYT